MKDLFAIVAALVADGVAPGDWIVAAGVNKLVPGQIAMMGGIIVATVLTLGFLPALYAAWFRVRPEEARDHSDDTGERLSIGFRSTIVDSRSPA
jgi:hypothetical protein